MRRSSFWKAWATAARSCTNPSRFFSFCWRIDAFHLLSGDPRRAQRLGGFLFAVAAPFRADRVAAKEARVVVAVGGGLAADVDRQAHAPLPRMVVERAVHREAADDHEVSRLKMGREQTRLPCGDELQ